MIIWAIYGLILNLIASVSTIVPNSEQYSQLSDIGKEYKIRGKVAAVSLSNERNALFFTTHNDWGIGNLQTSTIYRLDLDSNTIDKKKIIQEDFFPLDIFLDSENNIYLFVDPADKPESIYIYSENLDLNDKIDLVDDPNQVDAFMNSGITSVIALTGRIELYILKNKNGKQIATYYLAAEKLIESTSFVKLEDRIDTEFFSRDDTLRETVYHDNNQILVVTQECKNGHFSGFGCPYETSHIKGDYVDMEFVNKKIIFPTQVGLYDNKGRLVLIINGKLYISKIK
ncbi:MAG: hypothetical protein COY81_03370 [Candidatus Pacebacteria bacterium CG_4_10_14_0_8_um_filter_43_12]|nr:MAG: hypothetical protein COY81_03370 [Candidatus Pacebacteria bacterium CG_4_10_14_0_8_um_filter_43_12]